MALSKRAKKIREAVDVEKTYDVEEAFALTERPIHR